MAFKVGVAETADEKEAVYRFRYSVYVEEMGRYQGSADHAGRRLAEAEDERSWIYYARDGDELVGTARLSWGANGFSDRQVEEYSITPFLEELPHRVPGHRGTGHGHPEAAGHGAGRRAPRVPERDRGRARRADPVQCLRAAPPLALPEPGATHLRGQEHQHRGSRLPHPARRLPAGHRRIARRRRALRDGAHAGDAWSTSCREPRRRAQPAHDDCGRLLRAGPGGRAGDREPADLGVPIVHRRRGRALPRRGATSSNARPATAC